MCTLFFCLSGRHSLQAQNPFECHTGSVMNGEGINIQGNTSFAPCWPISTQPCKNTLSYAPDPDFPEHTPIKYVKIVLHIFQNSSAPALPPGNFTNSLEHINVLKSWFHHPTAGLNARMANLCDPQPKVPGFETPFISDSRLRFIFEGTENKDIFFYDNATLWGGGHFCGNGGTFYNSLYNMAVTNNPVVNSDPNILNSVHVFMVGASQNPNCGPNYGGGGYTYMTSSCGRLSNRVGIVLYGQFYEYIYDLTGQPPVPNFTDMPPNQIDIPYGGNGILSEFLHMASIDHPCCSSHLAGGDQCNDTPHNMETSNNVQQTFYQGPLLHESLRCAFTQCQLGRLHHFFEHLQPDWQRTPENNFAFPAVTKYCTISEPDIIIPNGANVVWERDRSVRSNIVVQPGGKLTIQCSVGLPKDARITVHPNGELYVDGARLHNNCDNARWEGIIVAGNSSLHQYKTYGVRNQALLILSNGATVSGANTAVRNYAPENPAYQSGGVIMADKATFKNNLIGVDFAPYQNHHFLYGSLQGDLSYFSNCSFLADAQFGADYGAFYSMASMRGVTGIEFQACTFANDYPNTSLSYADEKQYGIRATNAGFEVTGICQTNPLEPCTAYLPSEFRGFAIAISAGNYGSIKTFSVSNTNFNNNARGIVAQRVDNIYAVNNAFKIGAALPHKNGVPFMGIDMYRCTGYKVEENAFTTIAAPHSQTPAVGVLAHNSGSDPNTIYKNTYKGLSYANLSNGNNRGASAFNGLQYICNGNEANMFDIAVPAENVSSTGISMFQGSASASAGNIFSVAQANSPAEMHILNHAAPIIYFEPPAPTNYSFSSVTLLQGVRNSCASKLPGRIEKGTLSHLERQSFETNFWNETDVWAKSEMAGALIRDRLLQEDSIQLGAARTWLSHKGTLDARFAVVDSWIQAGSVQAAQQALAGIPSSINLSGGAQLEYNEFSALKNIQISALQAGMNETQMVGAHSQALKNIAEAGDYYASAQAQVLLNEVAGAGYRPQVILPTWGSQNISIPSVGSVPPPLEEEPLLRIQAVPNPATQETVFHYSLPFGTERAQIIVRSIDGRLMERISVGADSGHVRWNTEYLQPGIYLYTLSVEGGTRTTGRLVIIR